jgi:alanine dehydrogenase
MAIADQGWQRAVRSDPALGEGVNVANGRVVYKPVADALGLEYTPLASLID